MTEQYRSEEPPAPGHWRVTAQPLAAAPARPDTVSASSPAAPARTGGRPLLATLVCVGVLALWLVGQSSSPPMPSSGPAYSGGFVFGGASLGAILWGIAYAITIRKASTGWKAGSLIVLAVLGGLIALNGLAADDAAAPDTPPPVVRTGE